MAFIDTQNLFHAVRKAFGHRRPNFDPIKLVNTLCCQQGWCEKVHPANIHFYSGVPSKKDNPKCHRFWEAKLPSLGRSGIQVFTKEVRYRQSEVEVDGRTHLIRTGDEKGVDVRLALDVVRYAYEDQYDIALIFSQDQDFVEVATEVRCIARQQKRSIKIASAFPVGNSPLRQRGIDKTDWIGIDRQTYERCLDLYHDGIS